MKKILAVYDEDKAYGKQLAEYINRKDGNPFRALTFSSMEKLEEYSKSDSIEILLTSVREKNLHVNARYTFTLTEQPCVSEENSVWKYQPAGQLVSRLTAMTSMESVDNDLKNISLIGVYSPQGRSGKTTFSLLLGQVLARNQSVLYLNLEDFPTLDDQLLQDSGGNFSDAYFYYAQGTLAEHIKELAGHWHELDILQGAACPEDLHSMTFKELEGMLRCIAGTGIYETIIIDIGNSLHMGAELFSLCSLVYIPTIGSNDDGKLKKFDEWLAQNRLRGLECRIVEARLPFDSRAGSSIMQLEYQLWGEYGDYVRALCRREAGVSVEAAD